MVEWIMIGVVVTVGTIIIGVMVGNFIGNKLDDDDWPEV